MPAGKDGGALRNEAALVIVGRIRKPQGLHGELLVEPITDAPEAVFASGARLHLGTTDGDAADDGIDLTVSRARPFKDGYIVRFEGIEDRDSAETWRGRFLLTPAAELPSLAADEVYLHDLLGMHVRDDSAGDLGEVAEVYELPQGVTLEVRRPGSSVLIPYRSEVVREVDLDARTIHIAAPAGLLD